MESITIIATLLGLSAVLKVIAWLIRRKADKIARDKEEA